VEELSGDATVLDVASLFAPSVVEACLKRRAHDILLGSTHFVATEVEAPHDATLRELYGSLVPLGVAGDVEQDPIVCPGRDLPVRRGDRVTLLGTREELEAVGLIIAGTTLVTTLFALLTNALVARRIAQSLGQARIPGMSGHVVMVGLGSVGMTVLEGLRQRGREVVVVERDEGNRYATQVRRMNVPLVLGDSTLAQTLDSVNLAAAASVAIVTSDDMTNIETGLAVRDRLQERWADDPSCCACSSASWAAGCRNRSASATCGRLSPWPRRGSSAPHWGCRCSTASTSAAIRS
jgi:Trk K+ transport system NAD-binding subunit